MAKLDQGGGGRPKSRADFGSRMSVLLSNPDYLLEGFAEKKCQFVGIIEGVTTTSDMSDRSYLLRLLDSNRDTGKLPWTLGEEHNVALTVSAYNMKIIKDNRGGELLHRIPLHEIAAASYIKDDNHHLLFVKAGDANQPTCNCYTFMFNKRADTEELCSILQQAFQLVYTEATMEHLNESIIAGERGSRMSRSSLMLAPKPRSPVQLSSSPPKSPSSTQTTASPVSRQASIPAAPQVPTLPEEGETQDDSSSAVELVQDYMERLHKLLDFKELREFATLLKVYREDLNVTDFLKKLQDLYGEERKFLIPDMNSFIPEEDMLAFEKYLSDNDLVSKSPPTGGVPHPPPPPGGVGTSDVENMLSDLNKENENILTTNF